MNPSETRFTMELNGREIELRAGESTIGRSRGCTVTLKDTSVSRNHAVIEVTRGIARLTDLGSSNGTYVNGQRLQGSTELADGDRVTIGETDMRFQCTVPEQEVMETLRMDSSDVSAPVAPPPPPLAPTARLGAVPSSAPPSPRFVPPPPNARLDTSAPPLPTPASGPAFATPARFPAAAGAPAAAPRPTLRPSSAARSGDPALPGAAASALGADDGQELLPSIDEMDLASLPPAPAAAEASATRQQQPAGFWIRFAALVVDGAILAVVSLLGSFALGGPLSSRGSYLFGILYPVLGLLVPLVGWGAFGTTPGKRLFGLRVLTIDGKCPIGFPTALLRVGAYLLSFLSLGIGFLMVGVTAAKRGLHDLIAGTVVAHR